MLARTVIDVRTCSDGSSYEGQWVNGKKHGKGTYVWAGSKRRFTGEFDNDVATRGTLTFENGDTFEGALTPNAVPHGRGKYVSAAGVRYEGDFVTGRMHGQGKMTAPNGDWYVFYHMH